MQRQMYQYRNAIDQKLASARQFRHKGQRSTAIVNNPQRHEYDGSFQSLH